MEITSILNFVTSQNPKFRYHKTDKRYEAQIQESINTLVKNKTLLFIAHRLSTIISAEQIIVVNEGKIDGQGKHEDLLNTNYLYQKMWKAHETAQNWTFKS